MGKMCISSDRTVTASQPPHLVPSTMATDSHQHSNGPWYLSGEQGITGPTVI